MQTFLCVTLSAMYAPVLYPGKLCKNIETMASDIKRFIFLPTASSRSADPISCLPSIYVVRVCFTGVKRNGKAGKAKIIKINLEKGGCAGHVE